MKVNGEKEEEEEEMMEEEEEMGEAISHENHESADDTFWNKWYENMCQSCGAWKDNRYRYSPLQKDCDNSE